jgi:hypothetical protein
MPKQKPQFMDIAKVASAARHLDAKANHLMMESVDHLFVIQSGKKMAAFRRAVRSLKKALDNLINVEQ